MCLAHNLPKVFRAQRPETEMIIDPHRQCPRTQTGMDHFSDRLPEKFSNWLAVLDEVARAAGAIADRRVASVEPEVVIHGGGDVFGAEITVSGFCNYSPTRMPMLKSACQLCDNTHLFPTGKNPSDHTAFPAFPPRSGFVSCRVKQHSVQAHNRVAAFCKLDFWRSAGLDSATYFVCGPQRRTKPDRTLR